MFVGLEANLKVTPLMLFVSSRTWRPRSRKQTTMIDVFTLASFLFPHLSHLEGAGLED